VKKEANPFDPPWDEYFERRYKQFQRKRNYGKVVRPVQM
jgi:hypothetical protein